MIANRSVPQVSVLPVLVYEDVIQAAHWLCEVFGFSLRLLAGNHRAQLVFGDGAIMLGERPSDLSSTKEFRSHSLLVRVDDAQAHYEHVKQHGVQIVSPPRDYPYGERQYSVIDIGGHHWTFSESIKDVAPEDWGGMLS